MKFLACLFFFFLVFTSPVLAATFGPNIAGNINTANFEQIREAYGQSTGWIPATIMISPDDLQDTAKMQQLIDSATKNQIDLIIRIYSGSQGNGGNWDPLTKQDAAFSAQKLSQLYGLFPSGHKPQVEIGNELNSNWEWGGNISAKEAGEMFSAFLANASFPVMLPALNMFPGKDPGTGQETADYKTFLQELVKNNPEIINHPNLQMFAFNTYGNTAQEAANKWLEEKSFLQGLGFNLAGKQFVLTEAGPNPSLNMSLEDTEKFLTDMYNIFKNDPGKYAGLLSVTTLIFDENGNAMLASIDENGKIVLSKLASFGGSISKGGKKPPDKDCRAGCCPLQSTKLGSTNFLTDPIKNIIGFVLVPRRTACQVDNYVFNFQNFKFEVPFFGFFKSFFENTSTKRPGPLALMPKTNQDDLKIKALQEINKTGRYALEDFQNRFSKTPSAVLGEYNSCESARSKTDYREDSPSCQNFYSNVWARVPLAPNHQIIVQTTASNQDGSTTKKSAVGNVTAATVEGGQLQALLLPSSIKKSSSQVLGDTTDNPPLQFNTEVNTSSGSDGIDIGYSVSVQKPGSCGARDLFVDVYVETKTGAQICHGSGFSASVNPDPGETMKLLEPGWGVTEGDCKVKSEAELANVVVRTVLNGGGGGGENCSSSFPTISCPFQKDTLTGKMVSVCTGQVSAPTCNDQDKPAMAPPAAQSPSFGGYTKGCDLTTNDNNFQNSASNPQQPDSTCTVDVDGVETCTETNTEDRFKREKAFTINSKTGASLTELFNNNLMGPLGALRALIPLSLKSSPVFNHKEPVKGTATVDGSVESRSPPLVFPDKNASCDNCNSAYPLSGAENAGEVINNSLLPRALQKP